jgi:ubiquinone/menaquinone biosynthesis C-methylase UbiE
MRSIDLDEEKKFENSKILNDEIRAPQRKYYWATDLSIQQHRDQSYAAISGLSGLEIGCSAGSDAFEYAKYCAYYVGIDISDEAIRVAQEKQIPNCQFICTDGHKLPFDDESLDFVIVNSLLHHLDLKLTFPEISRVLKRSGKLIFREPLGTNPLFQIYRLLTPSARTADERPFTFSDVRLMKEYFKFTEIRWFGFVVIVSCFFKSEKLRAILKRTDDVISKTPFKYFFWQFSGVAFKK